MNKKSQGLSINVIVIVAIALIVLVVLIAIFAGRMGGFVSGVGQTTTCDVACQGIGKAGTVSTTACATGSKLPGAFSDVTPDKVCCCS